MIEKLYCYVDETGQDTRGELFIVSVVIVGAGRDQAIQLCEAIERATGKGRVKWLKTRYDRRLAYIRRVLQEPIFQGKLNFAIYQNTGDYQYLEKVRSRRSLASPLARAREHGLLTFSTTDYLSLTVQTIAWALLAHAQQPYKATVLIDGLPRSQRREVGSRLRHLGIRTRKVRGVRKDENDTLARLADALCGFVRAAVEGQEAMVELFEQGRKRGYLKELEAK